MQRLRWEYRDDPLAQAEALAGAALEVGVVTVEFGPGGDGAGLPWSVVEPWTRSRVVSLAVVDGLVASINAVTTVRDLMRSKVADDSGLVLELASFRLLFAQGDPGEGAEAFLDKREPSF